VLVQEQQLITLSFSTGRWWSRVLWRNSKYFSNFYWKRRWPIWLDWRMVWN
jgi:hypothetical protein